MNPETLPGGFCDPANDPYPGFDDRGLDWGASDEIDGSDEKGGLDEHT